MNTINNRIEARFAALASQGRSGLVTFITAGDPHPDATLAYMHALVRGGADVVELGVPFSDPMADGPTIQRASERALAGGMNLRKVLALVEAFRNTDQTTPVVLMGYLNPIERMGYEIFASAAAAAGADGVLTVDLPPEEAGALHGAVRAAGLSQIFLLAPTSSAARVAAVREFANGFVYYVSVNGVTGEKSAEATAVLSRVSELKAATGLPVGVGFGVRTAAAAAAVALTSDAVIVGSALIEIIENANDVSAGASQLEAFAHGLRLAMDDTRAAA